MVMPPKKPKISKDVARDISYAALAAALALLIAATFLLIFVRDESTVTTTITPTPTTVTPKNPLPPVKLQSFSTSTQTFGPGDVTALTSPIASVGVSTSTSPPDSTPVFAPGVVPFDQTITQPLQSPAEGFGWTVFLPDASQWFTSFQNGYALFVQYFFSSKNNGEFLIDKDAYAKTNPLQNRVLYNCPSQQETKDQPEVNNNASAVGSVGFHSMAASLDGLRLYVAYRQPLVGSSSTGELFPFLQLASRVAVFTRPITSPAGQPPSSNSDQWTYDCNLSLRNPFGSQVGGLTSPTDPITKLSMTSDDFGSRIKVSVERLSGNRTVAVRANYGRLQEDGAIITVYEEKTSDQTQSVSVVTQGIIQLSMAAGTFSLEEKYSFGNDFAIGDDVVVASVRVPSGSPPTAAGAKLVYYRYDRKSRQWEYKQTIDTPDAKEEFGSSIAMCPDGRFFLVGSPSFPVSGPNPGIGGSVYVYKRSADGNSFSLNQTFKNPFDSTHNAGAFGYFVTADPQFLVAAISSNQNNVLDLAPLPRVSGNPSPFLVFVSIDQEEEKLLETNAQSLEQPGGSLVDPTFGANVGMSFVDGGQSTLRVAINSPVNQLVVFRDMVIS